MSIRDKLCDKCKEVMKEYDRQNREKRKLGLTGTRSQNITQRHSGMSKKEFDRIKNVEFDDDEFQEESSLS